MLKLLLIFLLALLGNATAVFVATLPVRGYVCVLSVPLQKNRGHAKVRASYHGVLAGQKRTVTHIKSFFGGHPKCKNVVNQSGRASSGLSNCQ